ncbi:hypothetical protein [Paenisporosarcina antarctica]|uniref:Uncharacterized protein n=1 Tax=Paenisporosarcina antarctica TaxID=417367 RepID=A0A4P6ZZK0_9BACL|nr:hypothetical protein [Paenisporosarcina antarctica]QBP40986.1 hypothetical protein E2636_07535 [Paenisporosarcina antarctica]
MDSLIWLTIGFLIIGFVVLISLKKSMESKLVFINENMESEESSIKTKSIVWWIVSTGAWGIVSIILIVWSFHNHF